MKIQNNPVSLKGKDLLVYMESKLIEQYLEVLSRFSLSFKIGTTIFFFFVEKKITNRNHVLDIFTENNLLLDVA